MKPLIRTNSTKSAIFAIFLFVTFASWAASSSPLSFNELELNDGKVMTISRDTLSDREEPRRFKAPQFKYVYGTAKAVKSKLPRDFDTQKFMKDFNSE